MQHLILFSQLAGVYYYCDSIYNKKLKTTPVSRLLRITVSDGRARGLSPRFLPLGCLWGEAAGTQICPPSCIYKWSYEITTFLHYP